MNGEWRANGRIRSDRYIPIKPGGLNRWNLEYSIEWSWIRLGKPIIPDECIVKDIGFGEIGELPEWIRPG